MQKYEGCIAVSPFAPSQVRFEDSWVKDSKTIIDAVNYAKGKGVKLMIWYNSTTGWIGGAPGPKYRLNKPEDREKEFAWCQSIGVTGVKIDFFNGDGQNDIEYYHDLMITSML